MSQFDIKNIILNSGQGWSVAKALINSNSTLYIKAITQSRQKSQFTMNASQEGRYRSPELKFQMQFMGILAEIFAQEFLIEIVESDSLISNCEVIRYDDVRTDGFRSPVNEYDLKIIAKNKNIEFTVESRSSIARDRSLKSAIEQFDIIGPYTSIAKSGEKLTDFFIRPLYEFVPFATQIYLPSNFKNHLEANEINLYIVAGCTKNDMISNGYDKTMNQGGTLYRVVKITSGNDAKTFKKVISDNIK